MTHDRSSLTIAVGPSDGSTNADTTEPPLASPPFATNTSVAVDAQRTFSDKGTPLQHKTTPRALRKASFLRDDEDAGTAADDNDRESHSSEESEVKQQPPGLSARYVLGAATLLYFAVMVTGVIVMSAVGASIVLEGDRENAIVTAMAAARLGGDALTSLQVTATRATLTLDAALSSTNLGSTPLSGLATIQSSTQWASLAALNVLSRCSSASDVALTLCTVFSGTTMTAVSADRTRVYHDTVASLPQSPSQSLVAYRQIVVDGASTSNVNVDAAATATLPVSLALQSQQARSIVASATATSTSALASAARVDDFGFFASGTTRASTDATVANTTWVGTVLAGATLNAAVNGMWFDSSKQLLRQAVTKNVTSADGQQFTVLTSAAIDLMAATLQLNLPAFSRVCLLTTANGGYSLGCRHGGDSDEISASVIPAAPSALSSRFQEILALAKQQAMLFQPTSDTPRYVFEDKYETQLVEIGPAHVVAMTPFVRAAVVSGDGSTSISDIWFAAIITKPESVSFKYNLFSQLGLACLALMFVATLLFYLLVYLLYVRHIRDLTKRITEVSELNFSAIPDDDGIDAIETQSDTQSEQSGGALKQRNDELRCHALLRDIKKLYGEFFKVANALRAVVPFLPTSFVKKSSSKFLKNSNGKSSRLQDAANAPAPSNGDGTAEDKRHRTSLPDFGMDMSSEGSNTDEDEDDDDYDEKRDSHLSSISDVDLEDSTHSQNRQSFEMPNEHASMRDAIRRVASTSNPGASTTSRERQLPPGAVSLSMTAAIMSPTHAKAGGEAKQTPPHQHRHHHRQSPRHHSSSMGQNHNHRKHFTNETITAPAAIATFQLYLRSKARSHRQLVLDAQKDFFVATSQIVAQYRGAIVHMTPFSIVAEWASHESALRACTAAVEACRAASPKPTAGKEEYYRIGVGIDHGIIMRGVMGTQAKKVMICDGVIVQRSAILASVAVRNHCHVVMSDTCRMAVDLFCESRPVDVLAVPRSVRASKSSDLETVFECLRVNTGNEEGDEEWMYTLERKEMRESKIVVGDDPYVRGFTAWCHGDLSYAKGNWQLCLDAAGGENDPYLKRKLELLKDVDAATGVIPEMATSTNDNDDELDLEHGLGSIASKSRIVGTYRKVSTHSATTRSSSGMTSRTMSAVDGSTSNGPMVAAASARNDVTSFFKGVKAGKRPYFRATAVLGAEGLPFEQQ